VAAVLLGTIGRFRPKLRRLCGVIAGIGALRPYFTGPFNVIPMP